MLTLHLLALLLTTTISATVLTPRADPGEPCTEDKNCYGGANCCNKICTLGSCNATGNNAGAACAADKGCYGGAVCCSGVCTLGSCRMDGSCDAANDCYGWCHNNPGLCCFAKGAAVGTCNCTATKCPK